MAASSADSAREEPPPPVRRGARQQAALGTHAVPAAGIAGTVVELGMAGSVAAVAGGAALGCSFLSRLYHSVSPLPPTEAQLATEDLDSCPIFRHIPELRGRVAFREIGENYPTPIHSVTVDGVSFLVKREDLSSATYGGNKVRTLQHQLASCEAHLDAHPDATFTVVGSSGSNQSVATTVHGMRCFGITPDVVQVSNDKPDLDNTLNMLSVLSTGATLYDFDTHRNWKITRALYLSDGLHKVFPAGGNNIAGVLGQIGGALEHAEQISSGLVEDVSRIYLPIGSACTLTGLTIGTAIARQLGLGAFQDPDFKIVGVAVGYTPVMSMLHGDFSPRMRLVPGSLAYGIEQVCRFIASMGGPDFTEIARESHAKHVEICDENQYSDPYGSHSEKSRPAAEAFDAVGVVRPVEPVPGSAAAAAAAEQNDAGAVQAEGNGEKEGTGTEAEQQEDGEDGEESELPPLWLCGHFAAKPFAKMIDDLRASSAEVPAEGAVEVETVETEVEEEAPEPQRRRAVLFWQTKSAVQPLAEHADEMAAMEAHAAGSASVKRWAERGKAHSSLRPGRFVLRSEGGDPDEDYRSLMQRVSLPAESTAKL